MAKERQKIEFRYYDIPKGEYVMAKLGKGWIQKYGEGLGTMLHFHNYLEVGYCYSGKGRLLIENHTYRYSGKMFTVIPKNIPHTTISDEDSMCKWEYLFIDLDEYIKNSSFEEVSKEQILKICNKKGFIDTVKNQPSLSKLILKIMDECRSRHDYYKESLKGYLYAFIIEMLRLYKEDESGHSSGVNTSVRKAIDYLNAHYHEDISVSDLAAECGLSESHFRRVFQDSMNMKPRDYINMVRIDNACNLIKKGGMSMGDICYHIGYTTPSTFNRNFKALTGKTPEEWKKTEMKLGSLANFRISAQKGWEAKEK